MSISRATNVSTALIDAILWILLLVVLLPLFSAFIVFISGLASLLLDGVHTIEQLETDLGFTLTTSIISAILVIPLLKYSLSAKSKERVISKLALKPITLTPLIITLLVVLTYLLCEFFLFGIGFIETPSYILDIKAQIETEFEIALLFLVVGVMAPFFEEVIFRGIAFYKLEQVSLNPIITIVVTSIVFTLVHSQYEQTEVFILIFFYSCLLGLIRHLSGNLWYCIIGHMVMNITAIAVGLT